MTEFNHVAELNGQISWPYSILWPYLVAKSHGRIQSCGHILWPNLMAVFNLVAISCGQITIIYNFSFNKAVYGR